MIGVLISLVVLCLCLWVGRIVINALVEEPKTNRIVYVVFVVVLLLAWWFGGPYAYVSHRFAR